MNKILVLKDEAYAAVSSGSAIATIADIERLKQGAVAVFDHNGDVIAPGSLAGTYENIFLAVGVSGGSKLTTPIPVVVDKWNVQAYQAPVNGVTQVGALITAQVDTITLTGTSGTANVTGTGGLTKLATFNASLTQTATDFVSTHAAAYLAEGVVVTSNGADLIFTASVAGTAFVSPSIANATGDLAGTVVNTTANVTGTTLIFESTGDYSIVVKDNTFTNKYGSRRADASGYRQPYHSEEDVVDDVVAKLNTHDWLVATKTGSSTDGWGVSITTVDSGVILGVSASGMFEGTPIYQDGTKGSVVPVFGMGTYDIVSQIEKDYQVFEGNSGSIEYSEEWFSVPLEAVSGVQYEMINLLWSGMHTEPSTRKVVMNNKLVIAGVDGSTVLDNLQTIFNGILTTTGSKTVS